MRPPSMPPRLAAIALVACNVGLHPNDRGPGTALSPGHCRAAPFLASSLEGGGEPSCTPGTRDDCRCDAGDPPGVTDERTEVATEMRPTGAAYDETGRLEGCNADTRFAWPDCATVAEASVILETEPGRNFGLFGDHDYFFNSCPIAGTMRVDPFDAAPAEVRKVGSWDGRTIDEGVAAPHRIDGRLHVEVQDCRLFDGTWRVDDPSVGPPFEMGFRPHAGDLVSVAGDWVTDHGYEGHTEIHEARILAVTHALTRTISYSFVSGFFGADTRQADELTLDIRVPDPPAPVGWTLTCALVGAGGTPSARHDPTGFGTSCGVHAHRIDPAVPDDATATCRVHLAGPEAGARQPFDCQGTCDAPFGIADLDACDALAAVLAVRAEWRPTP